MCETISDSTKLMLNLLKWQLHLEDKKTHILYIIDNSNYLDNSKDNLQFIKIIKSIIDCKIFDISRVSYLAIKILECSFIKPQIIFNAMQQTETNNLETNNLETNNLETNNLETIIMLFIDMIIHIEIMLNLHCILIIHFLSKVGYNIKKNYKQNYNSNIINIFNKFDTLDTLDTLDTQNTIKQSTILLLLLKFINKLGSQYKFNSLDTQNANANNNVNSNTLFLYNLQHLIHKINTDTDTETKTETETTSINNITINKILKADSIKAKMHLDTFMLYINKYYILENNNISTEINCIIYNEISKVCITYIFSLIDLLFNQFDKLFDILEQYIILEKKQKNTELNTEIDKTNYINYITNLRTNRELIKTLFTIEITSIKSKFL